MNNNDPTASPAPAMRAGFDNIEAFSEAVAGWDLDFRQLDRGRGRADLAVRQSPVGVIQHVRFGRSIHQRGAPPAGFRTFGLLTCPLQGVRWNLSPINDDSIECFGAGREYDTVAPPGFSAFTISIEENHLAGLAERMGLPTLDELARGIVVASPQRLWRLKQVLDRALGSEPAHPLTMMPGIDGLSEALLHALDSDGVRDCSSPGQRAGLLHRALDYIESRRSEPLTVQQICEAVGAHPKTLQRAFTEHFDMPPKAYLLRRRLNGVHRDLVRAARGTMVADAANRWGFWHMGQFAADYRSLFGELPSVTLSSGHQRG